jgi:hypothetical protein
MDKCPYYYECVEQHTSCAFDYDAKCYQKRGEWIAYLKKKQLGLG